MAAKVKRRAWVGLSTVAAVLALTPAATASVVPGVSIAGVRLWSGV
jgi:hypothetical protein